MGEEADFIVDSHIGDWENYSERTTNKNYQYNTGDYMWKTSDGNIIPMSSMSIEHINNAITICEKFKNTGKLIQLKKILKQKELGPVYKDDGYQDFLRRVGDIE